MPLSKEELDAQNNLNVSFFRYAVSTKAIPVYLVLLVFKGSVVVDSLIFFFGIMISMKLFPLRISEKNVDYVYSNLFNRIDRTVTAFYQKASYFYKRYLLW